MANDYKKFKVIDLKVKPIYKIPEGYHVEFINEGRTLALFKDKWEPKVGEVYYEPMEVQYKPVKRERTAYDNLQKKTIFKTKKECMEWCVWQNDVRKEIYNRLMKKKK